ncbi:Selenocysteine lyase/Cysteine desulfurase [Catalinimonas alkaloidigena]|uniref:Selenocysteine lyase/Cysteine desulfurase n=1 Tax=Catalinimonas alkaloidigena TaxID=1075417 RepID=A0A1G9G7F2_9BACT|nr:aminotransferase class V-fold PLP-dependent enzyme [Catalinimonas alkaloidigena]SDK96527.1 Selenocysteine lyase/Cysteine desulfurase [Catalinimonas alkaloidigena]
MEAHFTPFRTQIIGIDQEFSSPYGAHQPIVYADWTASGRLYRPIEARLCEAIYPFVANTHTETNSTGRGMTDAYHQALHLIKQHVHAGPDDCILSCYSGMTGVVNKFQRILGLRVHERYKGLIQLAEEDRPVVFITHMEHHSNQTSWLETLADVEIIGADADGLVDLDDLDRLLEKYEHRKLKMAAVTSCSNVTGIFTPYHDIAARMHAAGGYCFVDFACSAPYIDIDMHPPQEGHHLDAIYFSPHKFLGGPGTTGILIFHKSLYHNAVPDNPGGGTVDWTNPWGEHKYVDDIEAREDGGTPAFLQTIKVALCIKLKEEMGVENMLRREKEQLDLLWEPLSQIPNLHLLAPQHRDRLAVVSFYIDGLHYNVGVKILNDRFGIQVRGGCSCAGTYGHYLLNVEREYSRRITELINQGDYSQKPGWIRLSLHPTTSDAEIRYLVESLRQLAAHHPTWAKDYCIDRHNEVAFCRPEEDGYMQQQVSAWFNTPLTPVSERVALP